MHFLHFVSATMEYLNIESFLEANNNNNNNNNNNATPISPTQNLNEHKTRVSNHTLCVSISNLNTTFSCQPIYDKLECVFNVNDSISICWCQSSLDLDNAYTDILTISIPKASMKILQKSYHNLNQKYGLMTHIRFDLDIQRSEGYNLRNDNLPIITTLISLEKVIMHTSTLGIITTNLFIKCIEKQFNIPQNIINNKNKNIHAPSSPQNNKQLNNKRGGKYVLFCIKDKLRLVCDLTDLPLVNTHIKAVLDQFIFQYQDDGRLLNNSQHLIRGRLTYHGFVELSDRNRHHNQQQKRHPQNMHHHTNHNMNATSMLNHIKNLTNIAINNGEPGSSWKRKYGLLMKKLEPLQGSFRMNDVMTISFLHHYTNTNNTNNQNDQNKININNNPFDTIKYGINRLQISIPQINILLKTLTLRRIIEMNTTSHMHIEIQDSPKPLLPSDFIVNILLELEEGIILRLAPHSIPYLLSAYYTINEFVKREQNDIAIHLENKENNNNNKDERNMNKNELTDDGNDSNDKKPPEFSRKTSQQSTLDTGNNNNNNNNKNISLSESVFNRYYLNRGLSPLSWKSQLSSSDFFGSMDRDINQIVDIPLFVIGNFELKARSIGLILYVDNNQKNNYVRLHLNYFKFMFNRKYSKEYLTDDHTQLIEDDINAYFGINQQHMTTVNNKIEHGLYVVPIQFINLDSSSYNNNKNNEQNHTLSSTKDLIAVPVCHLHYNAKTNIDDLSVTDIFDAKWGNQTFILPLDLRPFDNIGKTFKKYHRDYNEIIIKHNKKKQGDKDNNLGTINEKEKLKDNQQHSQQQQQQQQNNKEHTHKKSQTSSTSIASLQKNVSINKRTFNHDTYKFEPPIPSVKYIVSVETILEKLGIQQPQNTIPETFYSNIVEPISNSFRIIRGISQEVDSKLSPIVDDQQ